MKSPTCFATIIIAILSFTALTFDFAWALTIPIVPKGQLGAFKHGTYPSLGDTTHVGVDILAPEFSPIYAFADGTVIDTVDTSDRDFASLGNAVILEHSLLPKKFYTLYLHMLTAPFVTKGALVTGGKTVIGLVGKTGAANDVSHTHFEIRYFSGRYGAWGNIYGPGDQRNSDYFKTNWEDPIVLFTKYPAGLTTSGPKELLEYLGLRPGLEKTFIRDRRPGTEVVERVLKPEIRDSVEVWPLTSSAKSKPSSAIGYLTTDGAAIWLHADESESNSYTINHRDHDFLRHPLRPGTRWLESHQSGEVRTLMEIEAIENVVTPRGEFQNCLKVRSETGSTIAGHPERVMRETTWYCKGIGMVKQSTRWGTSDETHRELVEFKPSFPDVVVMKGKALPPLPKPHLTALGAFNKKYGDPVPVSCTDLMTNPFAYEGKTVGTRLDFRQMLARDRGFFEGGRMCGVVASGIPPGTFSTRQVDVVLVGRVIGTTQVAGPVGGMMTVPELRFVGVHICQKEDCADLLKD